MPARTSRESRSGRMIWGAPSSATDVSSRASGEWSFAAPSTSTRRSGVKEGNRDGDEARNVWHQGAGSRAGTGAWPVGGGLFPARPSSRRPGRHPSHRDGSSFHVWAAGRERNAAGRRRGTARRPSRRESRGTSTTSRTSGETSPSASSARYGSGCAHHTSAGDGICRGCKGSTCEGSLEHLEVARHLDERATPNDGGIASVPRLVEAVRREPVD